MPGIDKSRAVDLTEQELDEFTCSICLSIYVNPVFTKCCGQTYCKDCIREWVSGHESCPNDRTIITMEDLRPLPRAMNNLLGNIKIKCEYEMDGCSQVVRIEDLSQHLNVCEFGPNQLCKTCGLSREVVSTHQCLQSLIRENQRIKANNLQLLDDCQQNEEIISTLRSDIDQLENNHQNLEYETLIPEFCQSLERANVELAKSNSNKNKFFVIIAIMFFVFVIANIAGAIKVSTTIFDYHTKVESLKGQTLNLTEEVSEKNTVNSRLMSELSKCMDQLNKSSEELNLIKIEKDQIISTLKDENKRDERQLDYLKERYNITEIVFNFADKLSSFNLFQLIMILFFNLMIINI